MSADAIPGQLSFIGDDSDDGTAPPPDYEPSGLTRGDLMTAGQVSELLDVPISTVREWGRNGTPPRVKLGRHVRFIRAQVEAAILAAAASRPEAT